MFESEFAIPKKAVLCAVTLALIVVASLVISRAPQSREIIGASLEDDGRIFLWVDTCGGRPEVSSSTLLGDELRIELKGDDTVGGRLCRDGVSVSDFEYGSVSKVVDAVSGNVYPLPFD